MYNHVVAPVDRFLQEVLMFMQESCCFVFPFGATEGPQFFLFDCSGFEHLMGNISQ